MTRCLALLYAASTYAPPMMDNLLDLLTSHALSKMQPGGAKKTYTSKNIGTSCVCAEYPARCSVCHIQYIEELCVWYGRRGVWWCPWIPSPPFASLSITCQGV